jgi:predicted metallopeptidase
MSRGRKALEYDILEPAHIMIKKIVDTFPELFYQIEPDGVVVFAIKNQPPAHKNWLARVRPIAGIFKAIAEKNKWKYKFVIEIYYDDWKIMGEKEKSWILFHELLHIVTMQSSKMFKHDTQDFACILEIIGINKYTQSTIPDLFGNIKFKEEFIKSRQDVINKELEKAKEAKEEK